MTDIVKICAKHGSLTSNDVTTNNRCRPCGREYTTEYRKKNPDKIKAANDRQAAIKKEFKDAGFEYKPIRKNNKWIPGRTTMTCKKHGELSTEQMIIREGVYLRCRLCAYERNRSWEKINPEKVKAQKRRTYLSHISQYNEDNVIRQYKITRDEYHDLITKQNNLCAICGLPETLRKRKDGTASPLAIDHDHSTGLVRGLLCNKCNRGIGLFNESEEKMFNAIKYLRHHKYGCSGSETRDTVDSFASCGRDALRKILEDQ